MVDKLPSEYCTAYAHDTCNLEKKPTYVFTQCQQLCGCVKKYQSTVSLHAPAVLLGICLLEL